MSHRFCACHGSEAMFSASASAADGGRPFALPGDAPQWGRPRPFAIESLVVRVALDLDARAVDGDCEIGVKRIDPEAREVALDAIDFELSSVEIARGEGQWAAIAHHYDGREIRIDASAIGAHGATFRVRYRCTPRRGLYFVTRRALRARTAPDAKPSEVWSQGQDQDNRHWFPCADHPNQRMRTEMIATVPKGWFALSNGELVSRRAAGDVETFHWRQSDPHPSYLVTLACGAFDEAHTKEGALPIDYYVPRGDGAHIERSLGRTPEMIRVFAEKLRTPFPWVKYAQVVVSDFIFGGMENTSATTLFDRALLDERAALDVDMESLVSHELAHQWFGDLVTCRDWSHAWLNEGFATYLEHVWREHAEGADAYLYGIEQDLDTYLDEDRDRYRRPIVTNIWSAPIDVFDRHLYQKGGLTLHALRSHLGDDAFWRGIAHYLERMRGKGAETRDLMRAIEDATGRSLEAFFDQWVMKPGHPQLEISGEHESGVFKLTVTQAQAKGHEPHPMFTFDLPVIVVTDEGSEEHRVPVSKQRETFALKCTSAPKMVIVDPRSSVHGTVDNRLSTALLAEQLVKSTSAQPRWRAARALGKRNEPRAVTALAKGLAAADAFWAVRAECASALGEQRTEDALRALLAGVVDANPKVRRAVAAALGRFRAITPGDLGSRAADALLAWIERGDRSYLVESETRRALGRTRDPRAFDVLSKRLAEDGVSWADVVRQGTVDGLAATRDPRSLALLMEVLGDEQAPGVRRSALGALGRAREIVDEGPITVKVREAIEQTMTAFDPGVRIAACRALVALRDGAGTGAIARLVDRDLDGRVRRQARESLRDLRDRSARGKEVSALRDELERVRGELRELRDKVGVIDVRVRDANGAAKTTSSDKAEKPAS
ncbi:M1 family aminopeptidase [Sandaracinus amylolyticus]|nr:M1 family aminopeptidase [Sandaracinus amylolyticus]